MIVHFMKPGKKRCSYGLTLSTSERMTRKKQMKKRLVFISHCSTDTWVAEQIAEHVKTSGADIFLDESHIQAGLDFEEKILEHLNKSDEILALLTPWALKRPYLWAELGIAWGRGIPVIGILHGLSVGNLEKKSEAPIFLKKRSLIEINEIDKYFSELKSRSKTIRRKR
jgi:hypothetical protein